MAHLNTRLHTPFVRELLLSVCTPLALLPVSYLLRQTVSGHSLLPACGGLLAVLLSKYIRSQSHLALMSVSCGVCSTLATFFLSVPFWTALLGGILVFGAGQSAGALRRRIEDERQQSSLEVERRRLLGELNTRLLTARGIEEIQRQLLRAVFEICGRSAICYARTATGLQRGISDPPGLIISLREERTFFEAAESGQIVGVGTALCTQSTFRCYPIRFEDQTFCVIAVLFGADEQDQALLQFTDQLLQRGASALERQRLIDLQQEIVTEKCVEQMRANFLSAVSHDLRSPLAAIIGACSALEQVPDTPLSSLRLIGDIHEEAEWLTHMVENLLSITRVQSQSPKLNLSAEAVEEIVGEAAYKCTTRFPGLKLRVTVPSQVVILQMDTTLITQVLLNLVENAVKYASQKREAELTVVCEGDNAVFTVRDFGSGVTAEEMDTLFDAKGPRGGDSRHGLGIGLSICRTIVRAHGGEIWAENCPDGGAKFSFTLPLEEELA